MAKILTVIERAYHGTIEEQDDTILWITAMMKNAGGDMAVLLRGNAVSYALQGQDASGLVIGGVRLKPPTIDEDVAALIAKGVPVYAVAEDLKVRGMNEAGIVKGVRLVPQKDVAKLWGQHEAVWHW